MPIEWSDKYVLGIDEIDQQHRTIVERFTSFSAAIQEGDATVNLPEVAAFLCDYAASHFATEERYMRQYDYPRLAEQLEEHADFARDAAELRQACVSGASRELAVSLSGRMIRWIQHHINFHDRDMVTFVKQRMEANG